jgi:type II secretory pathway component PulF
MKKWRAHEISEFAYHLGRLLESGIPVIHSLEILSEQYRGVRHTQIIEMRRALEKGDSFAKVINHLGFPSIFVSLVGLAYSHGKLDTALFDLAQLYERKRIYRQQLIKKCTYPVFLFLTTILIMVAFFLLLIPRYKELLENFHADLPQYTKMIFNISEYLSDNLFSILIIILCLKAIFILYFYYLRQRNKLYSFLLRVPVVRKFLQFQLTHTFTSQIGHMLDAGMGILEAFEEISRHWPYRDLNETIVQMKEEILTGQALSLIKPKIPFLHKEYFRLVKLAESQGTLAQHLLLCSRLMEERINKRLEKLLKWIEPGMILLLGVIVAIAVLSLFTPMLEMIQTI